MFLVHNRVRERVIKVRGRDEVKILVFCSNVIALGAERETRMENLPFLFLLCVLVIP